MGKLFFIPACCRQAATLAAQAGKLAVLISPPRHHRHRYHGVLAPNAPLTGMTLVHDLALAHLARRTLPGTCLVAGGIQATFRPEELFRLGPFDLVVLGEGERPLRELARRLGANAPLEGIAGTAWRKADGTLQSLPQPASILLAVLLPWLERLRPPPPEARGGGCSR